MLAQIAGDQLAATLKQQRELTRERAKAATEQAATEGTTGEGAGPGTAGAEPAAETAQEREERAKAARAAEREAELERRAQAEAFNDRLGGALVAGMSRVKVDARVMSVLLSVSFGECVDALAMRGARYGFPGWVLTTEKGKREYLTHPAAGEKAREYLDGVATPGDYAGRALALLAMAVHADSHAVAMSNRTHHAVRGAGTPWAATALGVLDELIAENIPAGVLDEQLAAHAAERAAAAQRLADQKAAREQIHAVLEDPEAHSTGQLESALAAMDVAYERYEMARYDAERALKDKLRTRAAAAAQADANADIQQGPQQ